MILSKTKAFKYKGRKYKIFEADYDDILGFTFRPAKTKCILIFVNGAMCKSEKQLALHRLIKGKKLCKINTRKNLCS